jgi:hypothetical protein
MFRVADMGVADGTSRMGEIELVYSDIVLAFGEPEESDGYKVSGEWTFINDETGEVFTLYDWKSTSLYDSDGPSVEAFRACPSPQQFNIGGNHKGSVEEFKQLLRAQIEWVKSGKPLEMAMLGHAIPLIEGKKL